MASRIGNSEQIRRGFHIKCEAPFLERFVQERLQFTDSYDNFQATVDLLSAYQESVLRWTNGDSEQEGHLLQKYMKLGAFTRVI